MTVQARADLNNNPFILSGPSFVKNGITVKQDAARAAILTTFTVMGKSLVTIPTTMTADGGNTGDGTVTLVAAAAGGVPIVGSWELECTFAVVNGGVFKLTDPNGNIVADNLTLRVGAGLLTSFVEAGIAFTVTDGATDFAAGDLFTLAVTADGDWKPWLPGNVDGSEIPAGILMSDDIAIASLVAGDVTDQTMLVGGCCTIDDSQIVFDDGSSTINTVLASGETVGDALAKLGIFAESTVDIASYET